MKKRGRTILFENAPQILGWASIVGKKESEGPLGGRFDKVIEDSYNGLETYEDSESMLQTEAVKLALKKTGLKPADIDVAFAGDLLNQCVGSSFGLKDFQIPFLGQYGACSTMAQGLIMSSVYLSGGAGDKAVCVTSSHFCSAERQYRFPMEYGEVRTPTAQWTVTGAGGCVLESCRDSAEEAGECAKRSNGTGKRIVVSAATVGKILDLGVKDANNMGAAMAPAAADTIAAHLKDVGAVPNDYDMILTGDLGEVGSRSLYDLLMLQGIDIEPVHNDCGLLIFDREKQDVHSGGSGCGCCASVLCSEILGKMSKGELNNILFIATGALLSTTSAGQNKTIPSIAHLVNLRTV